MGDGSGSDVLEIQVAPEEDGVTLDSIDYLIAAASGLLSAAVDAFMAQALDLDDAKTDGTQRIKAFVMSVGRWQKVKADSIDGVVAGLEDKFPFVGDKLTNEFGGGPQHHLRDFSHHASPIGLGCSLFTQFTGKAVGMKKDGSLVFFDVPLDRAVSSRGEALLGVTVPQKLYLGVVQWFFHLVSDMAGSSSSAGKSGGAGVPGPIMSLVRTMASLPVVRDAVAGQDPKGRDYTFSQLASKLFNGTYLADHDETGRIVRGTERRVDLRMEVGLFEQLGSQAFPVLLNETVVRVAFALRRLTAQLEEIGARAEGRGDGPLTLSRLADEVDWSHVRPWGNRSVNRMLTVAAGVFTAADVAESVARGYLSRGRQPLLGRVNVVGVGRFAVAIGTEAGYALEDAGGPFALISAMGECLTRGADVEAVARRLADAVGMGQGWEYRGALTQLVEAVQGAAVGAAMPIPAAMTMSSQIASAAVRDLCAGAVSGPEFVAVMAGKALPPLVASLARNAPVLLATPGALPAMVWAGISYSCLSETARIVGDAYGDLQTAHALRQQVEGLCREKVAEAAVARAQVEELASRYLGEQARVFGEGLSAMDVALGIGDDAAFVSANAAVQEALGADAAFHTPEEFEDIMSSDEDLRL